MNDSYYLLFSIFTHDRHDYLLSFIKVFFILITKHKGWSKDFERQFLQIKETLATRILMGC